MKVMTAKEAKNSFGLLIDTAQREPVFVKKRNRLVGVFLSIQDIANIPELKKSLLEKVEIEASNPLLEMLGANKANRVFASSKEADTFLAELRGEWSN